VCGVVEGACRTDCCVLICARCGGLDEALVEQMLERFCPVLGICGAGVQLLER
jgi:hypothetical protein